MKYMFLSAIALAGFCAQMPKGTRLPEGREFASWEQPLEFAKTYYVHNQHPKAADGNPGTQALPWRTINKAAQVLQAGERVVIAAGGYRERVSPVRGGTGAAKMISYEAARGAEVVVKGSRLVTQGWKPSSRFSLRHAAPGAKIWQLELEMLGMGAYNPFGMVNVIEDRSATLNIGAPPQGLRPYLMKRGLVFVNGKRLEQAELYRELGLKDAMYWVEHSGTVLHVCLPGDADPAQQEVELVIQEQVFAPKQRYLGFIRIKGITFEHAANGFPVSQRGLVSANRGHHWIIEDCTIRHANSVALDIGNETWNAAPNELTGYSIVRRSRTTCLVTAKTRRSRPAPCRAASSLAAAEQPAGTASWETSSLRRTRRSNSPTAKTPPTPTSALAGRRDSTGGSGHPRRTGRRTERGRSL